MRKFEPSTLPITAAMAGAVLMGACSRPGDAAERDLAICRDGAGRRVADTGCGARMGGMGGGGFYYLGRGARVPAIGELVGGGSDTPRAGINYARASAATVSRGGFGGSAAGSSESSGHSGAGE